MQKEKFIISDADITSRCRAIIKDGAYYLLPRANRVYCTIPNVKGVQAQILTAPPTGARFTCYELHIETGGKTEKAVNQPLEQFLYVLEGTLDFKFEGRKYQFGQGGFCWLPPERPFEFSNPAGDMSRVLWLRRRYIPIPGLRIPDPIITNEKDVVGFPEDTYLEQHLVPYEDPAFDMGFNLLNFDPGVHFGFVESHIMEHGLYMLEGRGIYWLNGDHVEVQKDDYIYMAPYCPQFFYATGWGPARYMVYKDVNRDYTEGL